MGLFSFFNKKNGYTERPEFPGASISTAAPEIREEVFSEKAASAGEVITPTPGEKNINLLFEFLDRNHEVKGYDDALINPDASHLEQNQLAIKNELERTIRKVKTYYEDFIKEIDFHIDSRSRSGMIDTVEELKMKKDIAESHIKKVLEIEDDSRNNQGDGQGALMSYSRGFKNGLAAISHHSILKRKI
ncbi:MAG TPA: hypothetical protein VNS58_03105 [Puia sp.]|nr:hypothetical protein [Puia sp.]